MSLQGSELLPSVLVDGLMASLPILCKATACLEVARPCYLLTKLLPVSFSDNNEH